MFVAERRQGRGGKAPARRLGSGCNPRAMAARGKEGGDQEFIYLIYFDFFCGRGSARDLFVLLAAGRCLLPSEVAKDVDDRHAKDAGRSGQEE